MTTRARKFEITGGMVAGFFIGLPIAAMLAGFIGWISLSRHSARLSAEYGGQVQVVIVTEPIEAGKPVETSQLARRPVPRLVVSANTVSPDEVTEISGKVSRIDFQPGDLLLRSAFGLPPRELPEPEEGEKAP